MEIIVSMTMEINERYGIRRIFVRGSRIDLDGASMNILKKNAESLTRTRLMEKDKVITMYFLCGWTESELFDRRSETASTLLPEADSGRREEGSKSTDEEYCLVIDPFI